MGEGGGLSSFESTMKELFRRMGMPDPVLMSGLIDGWDDLAGTPWAGRSKPTSIQGKTLVVEASTPSMVAFLRYGVTDLLGTLQERFGAEVIDAIEVRPPSRG